MQEFIIAAIILIAFFCESLFGFGGGMLSIPPLSLLLPVKDAVHLVLIFQLLIGILIAQTWKDTDWRVLRYMLVGLLVGAIIGSYSLKVMDDAMLRKFLAISIVLFLIKMILLPKLVIKEGKRAIGFFAGFLGAYFQGIIGIGGPIFTMYLLTAIPKKQKFRATLIFIFFLTSVVRFGLALQGGLFTPVIWSYALPILIPFVSLMFVGQRLHWKVQDIYYRYAVYIILLCSSLSLFLRK